MYRRKAKPVLGEETEQFIHEIVIFIVDLLKDGSELSVDEITENVKKRGNLKILKRIAGGETLEGRMQVFLWQHPTIFTIDGKKAYLTPMSPDLDEKLTESTERRALEYIIFRVEQYGFMQVLTSTLFGHLHHAAPDIRSHFNNNFNLFHSFLVNHQCEFVVNENYVSLRHVYEEAKRSNKLLPKSDVYLYDNRVLQNTLTVVDINQGQHIINYILRTQSVVAIDCEGVNLGAKNGYITLIQVAYADCHDSVPDIAPYIKTFLFDIHVNRGLIPYCLKRLLQDKYVIKIFQGCSADSTSLYMKHRIKLENVFDTVIAHRHLSSAGGKADLYSLYETYVGEPANRMKKDIKKQYIGNPKLWATRPLTTDLTYYAAFDVYSLLRVYFAMIPIINKEELEIVKRKSTNAAVSAVHRSNPESGDSSRDTNNTASGSTTSRHEYHSRPRNEFNRSDHKYGNVQANGYHNNLVRFEYGNGYHSSSRGRNQNSRYNLYPPKGSGFRNDDHHYYQDFPELSNSSAPRGGRNGRGRGYRGDDSHSGYHKPKNYYPPRNY